MILTPREAQLASLARSLSVLMTYDPEFEHAPTLGESVEIMFDENSEYADEISLFRITPGEVVSLYEKEFKSEKCRTNPPGNIRPSAARTQTAG